MDNKITKRLTRDTNYKAPENTYQSTLSNDDIAKKLTDYERVNKNDIFKIPLGTHIRYFSINPKTGEKLFRLGGNLTKFGENNEYVVCSNGNFSWSVQLSTCIIYKKLSIDELKEKTKEETLKLSQNILQENKALKQILKEIKSTTEKSKEEKNKNKNKIK